MEVAPLVTVILPTFNRALSLPGAIGSVLSQSHRNLELIVVDDGSSDNTEAVVSAIADNRIRYLRLPLNAGQSAARNVGIEASRGDLVAFQDSDDSWRPHKLSRQVDILIEDPDLAGVYCDLMRRQLDGSELLLEAPALVVGTYFDDRMSLYQTYGLGIQSCVFRRNVLTQADGFREDMHCFEDLELLLRIARNQRMARIPEALVDYYESETSVSKSSSNERHARLFLLSRYGLRAFPRRPFHVLVEMLRCVKICGPRAIAASAIRQANHILHRV